MTQVAYIGTDEITEGCFAVYVTLVGGRTLYHEGPKDFAYFTKEQADGLASRLQVTRNIDLSHWDDGRFYRDDAQRIEVGLEDAYNERFEA